MLFNTLSNRSYVGHLDVRHFNEHLSSLVYPRLRPYADVNVHRDETRSTNERMLAPAVYNTAFSPSGRIIVATCADHSIRLVDAHNAHTRIVTVRHHRDSVNVCKFIDETHFATGSDDCTVKYYDTRQLRQPVHTLRGHTKWVKNIEPFLHNTVLTSGFDGDVRLTSLDDPTNSRVVVSMPNDIMRMKLIDQHTMAISSRNGALILIHNLTLRPLMSAVPTSSLSVSEAVTNDDVTQDAALTLRINARHLMMQKTRFEYSVAQHSRDNSSSHEERLTLRIPTEFIRSVNAAEVVNENNRCYSESLQTVPSSAEYSTPHHPAVNQWLLARQSVALPSSKCTSIFDCARGRPVIDELRQLCFEQFGECALDNALCTLKTVGSPSLRGRLFPNRYVCQWQEDNESIDIIRGPAFNCTGQIVASPHRRSIRLFRLPHADDQYQFNRRALRTSHRVFVDDVARDVRRALVDSEQGSISSKRLPTHSVRHDDDDANERKQHSMSDDEDEKANASDEYNNVDDDEERFGEEDGDDEDEDAIGDEDEGFELYDVETYLRRQPMFVRAIENIYDGSADDSAAKYKHTDSVVTTRFHPYEPLLVTGGLDGKLTLCRPD